MTEAAFDWRAPDYEPVWKERAERLAHLRATPGLLEKVKEHYRSHPAQFISDWCCTFDPRNPEVGLPATVPFLLFPKQVEYVDWLVARWKNRQDGLVEKSRDMGLSWLSMAFAVTMWLFHPGTVFGFGSRKEDYVDKIGDPGSLFWKGRMVISLLPDEFKPAGYDEKKHAPHMRLLNPENGSAIVGEAGDNIGRGNRTSMYFKDESAFYEHPDAIDAALSQTSNCKIDISTPNGEGNPFWAKRFGGKFQVFVFDWKDDPRKGKAWYEKQRATLDPTVLAQEVDRDYSASISNSFIAGDIITEAMSKGPMDVVAQGKLRIGLDVARFGDDKCVLTFRRGRVLLKQVKWGKTDVAATAARARTEINNFSQRPEQIAVDTIGIGAGAADILRGWYGKTVVDVNASLRMGDGKHFNLRAFMWSEMREWLKTASLPNDQDLRASLTSLRYGFRGGELLLESKDDMKKRGIKSPDEGDSLALTFAIPTKPDEPGIDVSRVSHYEVDAEMGM